MSLQIGVTYQGEFAGFARDTHLRFAKGARNAAEKQQARAKLSYRGAVRAAGLGDRLANAVRVDIYPKSASAHTHSPTVDVKATSSASYILYSFATGVTIKNQHGLWLAIPQKDTPRKGRRPATPEEVKNMYGPLIYFHGRGGQLLGFVDAIQAKSGKGFRRATKRRTKDGRQNELVLMFVFVRQVTLQKRYDQAHITDDLTQSWCDLVPGEIAVALRA